MIKTFLIDPGNVSSGVVVLTGPDITIATNEVNNDVVERILCEPGDKIVVFEDMKPYCTRFGQQTIDTCKFIGELQYRLKCADINCNAVYRWEVKKWVYDNYTRVCLPRIWDKIELIKKKATTDAEKEKVQFLKPHFVYVDDRIVVAAMKELWGIGTPLPGRKSQYGLSKHSWQALALYPVYTSPERSSGEEILDISEN